MRVLIAPDAFKGTLGALEAATAMARGAERASADVTVSLCPLSDGGEGFVEVCAGLPGVSVESVVVTGPLGEPVTARFAWTPGDRTAIIESAEAVGLHRVEESARRALATTTFGVGELVRVALGLGARRVIVGLGGTATTDGGAGMAQALGVAFDGVPIPVTGGALASLRAVDASGRDARLAGVELVAACDVNAPLVGPDGAACTYGPQKGATESEVRALDDALARLARATGDPGLVPGDGAAGGLGYGLRVFASARLASGIDFVLDRVGFDARLSACDLVLTGEGRLDAQSARGKVVSGVSARCRARGIPVVALVGRAAPGAELAGLTAHFALGTGQLDASAARRDSPALLEDLAENVVRLFASSRAPVAS